MSLYEALVERSDLAQTIRSKDEAYDRLLGENTGDRISAAEAFAEKAHKVYDQAAALPNGTLCFMANVRTLQEQTANILQAVGRDNAVLNVITPLAEELHVRL